MRETISLGGAGSLAMGTTLALLLAVSVLTGGVAAADTEAVNKTVAVDDNTQSVYVEATNTTQNLSVTVSSVDNGTETQLTTHTIAPTDSTLWTYSADNINTTENPQVRAVVTGANATDADASVEVGTIDKVAAGGGGGWLGGGSSSATAAGAVILVVAVGVVFLALGED